MRSGTTSQPVPAERKSLRRSEIVLIVAVAAAFLLPLLIFGPWEDEEVQYSLFPNQMHYRALFAGTWVYWFNNLGFGTPFPLGHRFDFNPLIAPLAAFGSMRVLLSTVWIVHTAIMVVYFLRLAAASGIRPALGIILLGCYLFSATAIGYFYNTDWLSAQVVWSLLPVVVFYIRQTVNEDAETRFWFATLRLAVVVGLMIANGNPGYVAPALVALGIYAIAAAPLRPKVYVSLTIGGLMALAINAERLYFVASEMLRFPDSITLPRPSLTLADWGRAALAPFTEAPDNLRIPFVGIVLGAAVLIAAVSAATRRDRHLRGCTIACLSAFALSLAPRSIVQYGAPSGADLFRDFVVLFALLAGGRVLQSGLDRPSARQRAVMWLIVLVQVGQQGATVWPALRNFNDHRGGLEFYRHQGHPVGLGREVVQQARTWGPRIYLSEHMSALIRGYLTPYGLHVSSDLALLGLHPVNGWFKGVSMDALYPSFLLMHGVIGGDADAIVNKPLLDVLGINLIWTTADERAASTLTPLVRTHVQTRRGEDDLVLFGNPGAWPLAVMMNPEVATMTLPRRQGCPHDGAMCRSFEPLAAARVPGDVLVKTDGYGHYMMKMLAASEPRLLFAPIAYRPEWLATSSVGSLRVQPIGGAFVGVTVPPGTTDVQLDFVPRTHVRLTWFSWLAFVVAIVGFSSVALKSRRSGPRV